MKPGILKYITLIILILSAGSCAQHDKVVDFDKEEVVKSIRLMANSYYQAIAERGLTAEFEYLDDSPDFFWVPPGYLSALSYDSVKNILETNAKGFTAINFHWDTLAIYPLTNEIANYSGIVSGAMTDTSNVTSDVSIIESGTFIRRETGWKFLSGQSAVLDSK